MPKKNEEKGKIEKFTSHFDLNHRIKAKSEGKNNSNKRESHFQKILTEIKKKLNSLKQIKDTKMIVSISASTLALLKCSIALKKLDIRDFMEILFLKSEKKFNEFFEFFKRDM